MTAAGKRKAVAARFSAGAATYDCHAAAQRAAVDGTVRLIETLLPAGRVLEIGCGTGLLTERLAALLPAAEIIAVDIASAMIRQARRRLKAQGRIQWIAGDIMKVTFDQPFDLVVSSSSLQWICPLAETFEKVHALLSKDGHLVFSIMLSGTLAELRASRERVAPHKLPASRMPEVHEVLDALRHAGFRVLLRNRETPRLSYASAAAFLKAIHEQGITSGGLPPTGTLLNRSELRRLVVDYDVYHSAGQEGVVATYDILYVRAARSDSE